MWLPVERSWRLNERHYGALQGLNKAQTVEKHGAEQVKIWRRSYDIPPPPLSHGRPTSSALRAPLQTVPPSVAFDGVAEDDARSRTALLERTALRRS